MSGCLSGIWTTFANNSFSQNLNMEGSQKWKHWESAGMMKILGHSKSINGE